MEKITNEKVLEIRDMRQATGNKQQKMHVSGLLSRVFRSVFLVSCFLLFVSFQAHAATLYFSPSSGEYNVGDSISLKVYVSSTDQAMNAASGVISFPSDKLQVTSLSKTGSIFSLWASEPSFSNSAGTVNFEGIVLNPGFIGASGKIITINFKVKAPGISLVNFSSGSILANDGKGTNILTSMGNAQFSLGGAAASIPDATTPSVTSGTPAAPEIISSTHPDSNKWYVEKDAQFSWVVPKDVNAVRILVGKIPKAIPTVVYNPPISRKEILNLDDGTWYLHVQFKNENGWGEISHFRFQIDAEKPSNFDITEIPQKDIANSKAQFAFDAEDFISGIDHYDIQIDNGDMGTWRDDGSHIYETKALAPGKHTLLAKAYDKAGNFLTNSAEFSIVGLNSPLIIDYTKELQAGGFIVLHGSTYPNSKVDIWLQLDNDTAKNFITNSDESGRFAFIINQKLNDGVYSLSADVSDAKGATSVQSEKLTVLVAKPALFSLGIWTINFLAIFIPIIALVLTIIIMSWYAWHKFYFLKKRIKKETFEAESDIHKAFSLLKDNMKGHMKALQKAKATRELTHEEDIIIKELGLNLDDAEKFIKKEIDAIEKEVK